MAAFLVALSERLPHAGMPGKRIMEGGLCRAAVGSRSFMKKGPAPSGALGCNGHGERKRGPKPLIDSSVGCGDPWGNIGTKDDHFGT